MFGLFRKKQKQPAFDPERVQKIVQDFGAVIAETDPGSFYDVSQLPYEKEEILRSLLIAIRITTDRTMRGHFEAAVMALPQFQDGVGSDPISPLPTDTAALHDALKAGEISVTDAASKVANAGASVDKERLTLLNHKSEKDSQEYLKLIKEAKGV